MLWILTILPSIFFSYYSGLQGGFFISVFIIVFHLLFKLSSLFWGSPFDAHDIQLLVLIILLQVIIVFYLGMLAEKLTMKELKLQQLNQKLEQISIINELTRLNNRRGFLSRCKLTCNDNLTSVCLYIDLDGFKDVNNKYSHDVDDQLLKVIAERLNICFGKNDIVGRLGGDEFVCMLFNADSTSAKIIAKKLILTLSKSVLINNEQIIVTPSIGIAISPNDGNSIEELIKNSDLAMYEAKR